MSPISHVIKFFSVVFPICTRLDLSGYLRSALDLDLDLGHTRELQHLAAAGIGVGLWIDGDGIILGIGVGDQGMERGNLGNRGWRSGYGAGKSGNQGNGK
jgi:hypothetical protein